MSAPTPSPRCETCRSDHPLWDGEYDTPERRPHKDCPDSFHGNLIGVWLTREEVEALRIAVADTYVIQPMDEEPLAPTRAFNKLRAALREER